MKKKSNGIFDSWVLRQITNNSSPLSREIPDRSELIVAVQLAGPEGGQLTPLSMASLNNRLRRLYYNSLLRVKINSRRRLYYMGTLGSKVSLPLCGSLAC